MLILDNIKLYFKGYRDDFSKAQCYEQGLHVDKNFDSALALYRQAMRKGDGRAYFRIGQWHQDKGEINQALLAYHGGALRNDKPSKKSLKKFAKEENREAIYLMGKLFAKRGNWSKALDYFINSATKGYSNALYKLGNISHQGLEAEGIEANVEKAIGWYRQAAGQGSKKALGKLQAMSSTQGLACFHLAKMYELGEGGLHSDPAKALELFRQSSDLGEPHASFYLGELYDYGAHKIYPDRFKAATYYALAAKQNSQEAKKRLKVLGLSGDVNAQYALGCHYYRDLGNLIKSVQWCVAAEIQGHKLSSQYLTKENFPPDVYLHIAREYELDKVDPIRSYKKAQRFYAKTIDCYVKAVASGDANAALKLAEFYQVDHPGIKMNIALVFDYYMKAATLGNEEACAPLERLAEEVCAQKQKTLSQLYDLHFKNKERAEYWNLKSQEITTSQPINNANKNKKE